MLIAICCVCKLKNRHKKIVKLSHFIDGHEMFDINSESENTSSSRCLGNRIIGNPIYETLQLSKLNHISRHALELERLNFKKFFVKYSKFSKNYIYRTKATKQNIIITKILYLQVIVLFKSEIFLKFLFKSNPHVSATLLLVESVRLNNNISSNSSYNSVTGLWLLSKIRINYFLISWYWYL